MSIVDLILDQKIILITAVLAGMVLFAAIGLLAIGRLKKYTAKRARKQALRRAARAKEAESQEEAQHIFQQPVQPITLAAQQATPIATSAAGQQPVPIGPPAQMPHPTQTTTPASTAAQGQEVPKAMQEILSSVFADEESLARYAVLLSGLDHVDVTDLRALCDDVAARLKFKNTLAAE